MTRRAISKRVRFEVFKRDGFTCRYCGAAPPAVVLEVDHIEPLAEGGADTEDNLLTACFGCNRGKGAVPLDIVPETVGARGARLREAEDQLRAYRGLIAEIEEREEADVWTVIKILYATDRTTHDRFQSVRTFLKRMDLDQVHDAARIAVGRGLFWSESKLFRYFCGVCWNMIREANERE